MEGVKQWLGLLCSGKGNVDGSSAMATPVPILKDLVLVGGGHAHVHVLKMFGMQPQPGVRLTLITRDLETPYSGMLPGYVAGIYSRDECHIDLGRLARFCGATLIHAEAVGIDRENQEVFIKGSMPYPPVRYDVLSVDIGISPAANDRISPGSITPVKPIDGFSARWSKIIERLADVDEPRTVVVVGGGAGGVELCLAMQARLAKERTDHKQVPELVTFMLVCRSSTVLPSHNSSVQAKFKRILKERDVTVMLNAEVVGSGDGELEIKGKDPIKYDECVWCTQASTQPWLKETGLELVDGGFIAIKPTLQSVNTDNIFAAGDVATMVDHPRPKAGVFAVRQGPPLVANLRRALGGEELVPFVPQTDFMGLIGTGTPSNCVLSRGSMALEGSFLWEMKDWIDKKWMASYTKDLPFERMLAEAVAAMPDIEVGDDDEAVCVLKEAPMRCGGCGAKVGATVLSNVMARVSPLIVPNKEVLVGVDHPDDCAVIAVGNKAVCQSVDFFRAFINDPFIFGRIAANHALSDCHAMGIKAQSALAIAVIPYAKESIVESTLHMLMAGAAEALRDAECTLVGGHTCEGQEMALGFSVTGVANSVEEVMGKEGLKPGDKLIITKAVGTGALFAADMRGAAKGPWIDAALESMCLSSHAAGPVLRKYKAKGCTDVTGFGLLGHLFEMCKASGATVELDVGFVPLLDGALECVSKGITSSLQPQNLRLKRAISNQSEASKHPFYPLLFDPQTAGGLLASVPNDMAADCVAELKQAGYPDTKIIGTVMDEPKHPKNPECIKCLCY